MDRDRYITITELSTWYQIDREFLHSLREYGLVEIIQVEKTEVVEKNHLRELEKMMRMHYELNINLEGIDAISHLLNKITSLQDELRILQNRLNRFNEE